MEAERQTVTGKQPPPLGQEDTEKRRGYKQGPGTMPSSFWEWQKLETELTSAARAKKCCYGQEGKWKKESPFPTSGHAVCRAAAQHHTAQVRRGQIPCRVYLSNPHTLFSDALPGVPVNT